MGVFHVDTDLIARFGTNDEYEIGTILHIRKTFNFGEPAYDYVAIKTRDTSWYLTGSVGEFSFHAMVEKLTTRCAGLEIWMTIEQELVE
jgi:hypothetical protein